MPKHWQRGHALQSANTVAHDATCGFLRAERTFVKPAECLEIGLSNPGKRRADTSRSSPQESTATAEPVLVLARRSNSRGRMALGSTTSTSFRTTERQQLDIGGLVDGCRHDQLSRT